MDEDSVKKDTKGEAVSKANEESIMEAVGNKEFSAGDMSCGDDYRKMKEKLEEYKCPICMEILVKTSMISCGHRFCLYCIKQWFHHSFPRRFCPVCRKNCIYYQDDGDTDVNISNIYHCLPLAEQEERNMILLDREYLSTLPLSRIMPETDLYFDEFVDELSHSWASQYSTELMSSPFEFEGTMDPIMTESYYPLFQHYSSTFESPFHDYHPPEDHHRLPNGSTIPLPPSATEPPPPDFVQRSNYLQQALPPPPPPQPNRKEPSEILYNDNNNATSRAGDYLTHQPGSFAPSQAPPPPAVGLGSYGYPEDSYLENGLHHGDHQQNGNLEFTDPSSLWNPHHHHHHHQPPSLDQNLAYDSISHVQDHPPVDPSSFYSDSLVPPFRLADGGPCMNWAGRQQLHHGPSEWQLMNGQMENWCFPSSTPITMAPELGFCGRNNMAPSKFSKKTPNHHVTHEDYQQDVLIQEEFQRLDEMLLRDDDEDLVSLSDVDQVSVESVVSSEQQYDSPWENGTEQGMAKGGGGQSQVDSATGVNQVGNTGKKAEGGDCEANRVNNAGTTDTAVSQEFRQNCEQVMIHSSQRMGERRVLQQNQQQQQQQQQQLSAHTSKNAAAQTTAATTVTTTPTMSQSDSVKKMSRLKTFELPPHQQLLSQQSQLQKRYPDQPTMPPPPPQPTRILESKRSLLERIPMDEVRVTDRPAVQTYNKPYQQALEPLIGPMSPGPHSLDFRSTAPVTARRTPPRLPRIRMDAATHKSGKSPATFQQQQQQQQQQALKRKPPNISPTPPPSAASVSSEPGPPVVRNMMGISQGDGVWGTVPEMNARMYLPNGILLFRMEYQPMGNSTHAFSPRKQPQQQQQQPSLSQQPQQQQQQQQQHQRPPQQVTAHLAKFTHPIIHMLPLSSDGSTRLNVTFDVIYQN